jgi:hypothetical protein
MVFKNKVLTVIIFIFSPKLIRSACLICKSLFKNHFFVNNSHLNNQNNNQQQNIVVYAGIASGGAR